MDLSLQGPWFPNSPLDYLVKKVKGFRTNHNSLTIKKISSHKSCLTAFTHLQWGSISSKHHLALIEFLPLHKIVQWLCVVLRSNNTPSSPWLN